MYGAQGRAGVGSRLQKLSLLPRTNSQAQVGQERQGPGENFLPELPWARPGGPGEALRVGAGRGKAVNWLGAVGLSCRCRWPPPLSSCVTEECSYSPDKGSFVWRPQEGEGGRGKVGKGAERSRLGKGRGYHHLLADPNPLALGRKHLCPRGHPHPLPSP